MPRELEAPLPSVTAVVLVTHVQLSGRFPNTAAIVVHSGTPSPVGVRTHLPRHGLPQRAGMSWPAPLSTSSRAPGMLVAVLRPALTLTIGSSLPASTRVGAVIWDRLGSVPLRADLTALRLRVPRAAVDLQFHPRPRRGFVEGVALGGDAARHGHACLDFPLPAFGELHAGEPGQQSEAQVPVAAISPAQRPDWAHQEELAALLDSGRFPRFAALAGRPHLDLDQEFDRLVLRVIDGLV